MLYKITYNDLYVAFVIYLQKRGIIHYEAFK